VTRIVVRVLNGITSRCRAVEQASLRGRRRPPAAKPLALAKEQFPFHRRSSRPTTRSSPPRQRSFAQHPPVHGRPRTAFDHLYTRSNVLRRGNDRLRDGNRLLRGGHDLFRLPHEFLRGRNNHLRRSENRRRGAGGCVPKPSANQEVSTSPHVRPLAGFRN